MRINLKQLDKVIKLIKEQKTIPDWIIADREEICLTWETNNRN